MKKKAKKIKPYTNDLPLSEVNEPVAEYVTPKALPVSDEYAYRKFDKLLQKVPFTQHEWAEILHVSDKTLQRYAKDNTSFEGLLVDRLLQMEDLIIKGLEAFENGAALYAWLKKEKPVLGYLLNFDSLRSAQGIQFTRNELERILHGVYI